MIKGEKNMIENPLYNPESIKIIKRHIKHPIMIKGYVKPNYNMTTNKKTEFIGLDFETEALTGELILFGIYYNETYFSYHKDDYNLLNEFCKWIKIAIDNNMVIVHWTKFDQNAIVKMFLKTLNKEERIKSLNRYGKTNPKYDKETGWDTPPLCEYILKIKNKTYTFGISFVLDKKMINCFMLYEKSNNPLYCNIIDMNSLYKTNLEKAAENNHLTYYNKMNEGFIYNKKVYSYHIVDWNLYKINNKYKEGVLLSNELDCRAVKDLANEFILKFYRVFKTYPKILHSTGSLAKMALSVILNEEDYNSINFINQLKNWGYETNSKTKLLLDKLHTIACESYSGGLFELYAIGKGDVYVADISACYPASINKLLDLRDSKITYSKGIPPKPKENEYIFIRGTIDIPFNCIHTFRIFNPDYPGVILRPYGILKTSYIWQEREFALEQGCTFSEEEYFIIKTTNKENPLAKASKELFKMRQELIKQKDNAQIIAKQANNSCYGITIEGTPLYRETDKGNYTFDGFRAGAFYNPILASLITAFGRITLCSAMITIKKNGGQLIQANTDSIHWKGDKKCLPKRFNTLIGECGWTNDKQIGYFEEPTLIKDFISLATGRYGGYDTQKEKYFTRLRSYYLEHNPKEHYLLNLLKSKSKLKECKIIPLPTNNLVTIKLSNNRTELSLDDVCRIDKDEKDMKIINIEGKRICKLTELKNPIPKILKEFTDTEPFSTDVFIKDYDYAIKKIRYMVVNMSKGIKTKKEKRKEVNKRYESSLKRREYDKQRKRRARAELTEEEKMIIRFKDRERKRRNKNKQ